MSAPFWPLRASTLNPPLLPVLTGTMIVLLGVASGEP